MIKKIKEKLELSKVRETLYMLWKVLRFPIYFITVFVLYGLAIEITTLAISVYLEDSANLIKNMSAADSVLRAYTIPIVIGFIVFNGAFIIHKKIHHFVFKRNKDEEYVRYARKVRFDPVLDAGVEELAREVE